MDTIKVIHGITLSLYEQLKLPFPKNKREDFIEKVNVLLELREQAIKTVPKVLTEEDKQLGNEIIKYNLKINEYLSKNIKMIKSDIKTTRQRKETGQIYENPYETSMDGMFFDKKK